jgi:L-ascorbate metabolism protein UlaG (beta-lactamase superfamily)
VATLPPRPATWSRDGLTLAWLGHATFLIRLNGWTILTDPVFSQKIGPELGRLVTVGPPRLVPPAIPLDALPPLDLILVSHAHMDHFDLPSLRRLGRRAPLVVARGTRGLLRGAARRNARELDWGQRATLRGLTVEAIRVKHWGQRYPWDRRERGYNAYVLRQDGLTVLFGGDTAYTPDLARRLGGARIDAALLPIGGYNPYIWNHLSPEQAWQLSKELGARYVVPMHWRTFRLSDEPTLEPIARFEAAAGREARRIALRAVGETWSLPG